MSTKVGIFFGGPSREREISFAGGRTVYDNLDKRLFEAVPIFVDSFRRWYLLDWQYLYRGSIRDFFPPIALAPKSKFGFQVYQESLGPLDELALEDMGRHVGRRIRREELPELIDVAFLALHGEYGEDGQLQKELEYAGVPYTGSGVRASEIGMDKALQKELMAELGFPSPAMQVINKDDFSNERVAAHYEAAVAEMGWPLVVRPSRQGSSIGVSILEESAGLEGFERAVNAAFFREVLPLSEYRDRSEFERLEYVRTLSDLRDGLGFPLDAEREDHRLTLYTPDDLHDYLENAIASDGAPVVTLRAHQDEERVIIEAFIRGKEFSTIVLRTPEGGVVALPPTEIVKVSGDFFDYRSKYLPGLSRKVTPIDLPTERINAIRKDTERLFTEFGFATYARIDGFHTEAGEIYLNDPNTTSGMLPSSFFFHQAAEIGLNPSQFLTYLIHTSLKERGADEAASLIAPQTSDDHRARIGVLLGGTSFERHISVESGRNVYEKLASSADYHPLPIFLTGGYERPELYQLPINLLLKDNADDIRDQLTDHDDHPVIEEIRAACKSITERYADPKVVFKPRRIGWNLLNGRIEGAFIALHGRPGEDGRVQRLLEEEGIYYNGSRPESAAVTIDKYRTLELLREAGMPVTDQLLADRETFLNEESALYDEIERRFGYPLIAKPVDDGCSSAVKVIKQRDELHAYCHLTFNPPGSDAANARRELKVTAAEEWPQGKETILFEKLIGPEGADKFLEITGGMLTHRGVDGELRYEVFEPSEALAEGEVLSLEEKFLAGQGQNLTPARFATDNYSYNYVAGQVKADLEKAARVLGVTGYCRIDAFVRIFADGKVETIVIEVNSLPGMTPATAIFHQAAIAGYQPHEFIGKLLEFGKTTVPASPPPLSLATTATALVAEPEPLETKVFTPPPAVAPSRSKKPFLLALLKNVALAAAFLLMLFVGLRSCLNWYTNHGESQQLPTFTGLNIAEVRDIAAEKGLKLNVKVGSFDADREPGLVVMQIPKAGSQVKDDRTIYLTILSEEAPMIELPPLKGNYDYDQYVQKLKAYNIRFRVRDRQLDTKQEEGTILHFFYDDRKITENDLVAGVSVPQGSTLEFVTTIRDDGMRTIPSRYRCKTFGNVEFQLDAANLVVGKLLGNFSNRNTSYVVRTDPAMGTKVAVGSKVDFYLSDSRPGDCN